MAMGIAGITLLVFSYKDQAEKEGHARQVENENKKQMNYLTHTMSMQSKDNAAPRGEVTAAFKILPTPFRTNAAIPPDVRLSVLLTAKQEAENENTMLNQEHEILDQTTTDFLELRKKYKNELDQQDVKKRLAAIANEIEQVQAQLSQRQNDQAAKLAQEQQTRRQIDQSRKLTKKCSPIFDYTIARLSTVLAGIASQTGEKRQTDFSGNSPTIYGSRLISEGLFTEETNFISIGTNAAWRFNFSIATNFPQERGVLTRRSVGLCISCETTNGTTSCLWIYPAVPFRTNNVKRVRIDLNVTNGLSMSETNTDPTNAINEALDKLIFTQDQIFSLPLKTNAVK